MKQFIEPEIEILEFNVEDIVTTSAIDLAFDDIGWG